MKTIWLVITLAIMAVLCSSAYALTNFAASENYANAAKYPAVIATASDSPELAANLIDGDSGTAWSVSGAIAPLWVTIDLGTVRNIGGIALLCGDAFSPGPRAASIEVGGSSADPNVDADWTIVGSSFSASGDESSSVFRFTPRDIQKVRIRITEIVASTCNIYDVAVMSGTATTLFYNAGGPTVPWLAVDGSNTTYSNTANNTSSSWQVFDIGQYDQIRSVRELKVHFASGQTPPSAFRLQYAG
ncbi:MAG: discoidin domain-containing protein, partial [Armatimonadota bacterium]